jgi:hypothetical protein
MSLKTEAAVVALVAAAAMGGAGAIYWSGRQAGAAAARPEAAAAVAQAAARAAQAGAALDAGAILDRSAERARVTVTIEGDHRAAIQAAPGADARLDVDLLAAARRGLCQYAAYAAVPGCAVLAADPAELPPARGAGPAAGG